MTAKHSKEDQSNSKPQDTATQTQSGIAVDEQMQSSLTQSSEKNTDPSTHAKQTSMTARSFVPVLIVLVGVLVLLYPVLSTLWNNMQHEKAVAEYSKYVRKADPSVLKAQIERAHEYNRTRTSGPILDPWLARVSTDNVNYQEYLSQLNLTGVMARIAIPSIKVDLPVYHGTSSEVLATGVGHLFGTDLPVGGVGTHAVLTGHTGLQTATLFDNLAKINIGQSIYIEVYGQKMRYVVTSTEVVLPDEAKNLYKEQDKDLLTLITCTPYGINSHRLLVHAQRAPMTQDATKELNSGFGLNIPIWMICFSAVALLALIGIIVWAVRQRNINNLKPDINKTIDKNSNNCADCDPNLGTLSDNISSDALLNENSTTNCRDLDDISQPDQSGGNLR